MPTDFPHFDALIIGAGMAGASLGAEIAADMAVLMIEQEDQPGYHATGRSVAFWSESYGGPLVRPLTQASLAALADPDPAFSEDSFLSPRGAVHIGNADDATLRDRMIAAFADNDLLVPMDRSALETRIPGLRPGWSTGVWEASTADIDVATLHAAYLRQFRQRGGTLWTDAALTSVERSSRGWTVLTAAGACTADILINAAGAWADPVARLCGVAPLGIQPLLRNVAQLRTDPAAPADLPLVLDLAEQFYFKPAGGGRIWLTPHDEHPALPCDAGPDDLAIATAIARFEQVVDWKVEAVERKWAGLRSFAPDRLPVYGFDRRTPGFFWFAGQGGFGIQTAPAAALLARARLTGAAPHAALSGIDLDRYDPARFG
ncbi:NAD(P)/FAD-dependent oxidoreductase [Sphingobium subterraneum]|uniref:D-arginine dehydrogenase n=1 Tax=Sphingobium subterraneum TaxID=627688 RepID=A0A841J268_9SPHN|nr:FAD-binding oxidoreductase [Sphingobium subterraneum]MBB6124794.1 D-arginine dehydrogenase [Sphingobium subterraneum]